MDLTPSTGGKRVARGVDELCGPTTAQIDDIASFPAKLRAMIGSLSPTPAANSDRPSPAVQAPTVDNLSPVADVPLRMSPQPTPAACAISTVAPAAKVAQPFAPLIESPRPAIGGASSTAVGPSAVGGVASAASNAASTSAPPFHHPTKAPRRPVAPNAPKTPRSGNGVRSRNRDTKLQFPSKQPQ